MAKVAKVGEGQRRSAKVAETFQRRRRRGKGEGSNILAKVAEGEGSRGDEVMR